LTDAPAVAAMPRRRNARAISFETSSSSSGANTGRASSSVTSAPSDRYSDANSRPTAPAPITIADAGIRSRNNASSLVTIRSVIETPGSSRGADPVATTTSPASILVPSTSTAGPGTSRAAPRIDAIPRCLIRPVTPLTSLSTTFSSNASTADQSGSPEALMPHSWARLTVSMTAADCNSALVGIQPRNRHVPPSRSSRSTRPTFLPSCAARSAAE
jgi:hypothetical protein